MHLLKACYIYIIINIIVSLTSKENISLCMCKWTLAANSEMFVKLEIFWLFRYCILVK